ncbi:MAG: Eco57I restriction-modification methylase domain-containing protein, partial [Candidatus Hodarchaeota archaeon]
YSLDSIKKVIAEHERKGETPPTYTNDYWKRLRDFFDLINEGSEARGIPKEELYVPAYNGGLFDPDIHRFLINNSIGDYFTAKVIDLLARAQTDEEGLAFVDYSTLEIRHLGSIYEGLLENKLKLAEQDLIAIKEKEREIWVPVSEIKGPNKLREGEKVLYKNKAYKIADIASEGSVYLVTDKGERKATGSYYTPGYIVEYIVGNTLGAIIDEKKKANGNLIDEILSIKVLDPAMGSGHFLVEATNFLARALVGALAEEEREFEEDEIRVARREVVERCIFGVDLNPLAVELAKLSLWLSTVSTNNALSFLDHHLKCGNSLIGAQIGELGQLPDLKNSKRKGKIIGLFEPEFMKKVGEFLQIFEKIEAMPSDNAEQVKEKTRMYNEEFEKKSTPFKAIANLWLSGYFGNKVPYSEYSKLQMELANNKKEQWEKYSREPWFNNAMGMAKGRHFFHWELEFPEVFFEKGAKKENPGFDAVIGNPPYINAIELNRTLSPYEKPFWKTRFVSASGAYDVYLLFFELGLQLVERNGLVGLITPNKFLSAPYGFGFRSFIVSKHQLISLCDWSRAKVFEDPSVYPVVTIFRRFDKPPKEYQVRILRANSDNTIIQSVELHGSSNLSKLPELLWGFLLSSNFDLVAKISLGSNLLGKVARVQATSTAAESDEFTEIIQNTQNHETLKLINTGLIDRYSILWGFQPLDHKGARYETPYLRIDSQLVPEPRRIQYKSPKIIFAKIALCIEGCLDTKGELASINTNSAANCKYSLSYICSLVNSKLMTFMYNEYFGALRMSRGYFQFQAPQLEILPIRTIFFVTPEKERERLKSDALSHYANYIPTGKADTILSFVKSRLTKQHKPDARLAEKHNSDPINQDWRIPEGIPWEQSDVIHDILTFLAEKMVEFNREKQHEIMGFLKWLETQIKVIEDSKGNNGIEALIGKSQIKNYLGDYEKGEAHLTFPDFWKFLDKNKTRIRANLKSRDVYQGIKKEYEKSISALLPLKEKLSKTDYLIDQIVYRLYGITEKDIRVIEKSISN